MAMKGVKTYEIASISPYSNSRNMKGWSIMKKFKKLSSLFLAMLIVFTLNFAPISAQTEGLTSSSDSKLEDFLDVFFDSRINNINIMLGTERSSTNLNSYVSQTLSGKAEANVITQEIQRSTGFMNYLADCDISIRNLRYCRSEAQKVSYIAKNIIQFMVYEWTQFDWDGIDSREVIESGFGTWHNMSVSIGKDNNYTIISDIYDEHDITGISSNEVVSTTNEEFSDSYNSNQSSTYNTLNEPAYTLLTALFLPSAAVSYANSYVGNYDFDDGYVQDYTKYNKQYKNCNVNGGDCVNYVSQCLYYAGLPQVGTWTYSNNGTTCTDSTHLYANNNSTFSSHTCTNDDSTGAAWISTSTFKSVISANYSCVFDSSPDATDFLTGDVVFSDGEDHTMICVGREGSNFLINGHNTDRKQVAYTQNMISSEDVHRLHIHPYGSWTYYNTTYHSRTCSTCGNTQYGSHYKDGAAGWGYCAKCGAYGNWPGSY